MSEFPNLTDHFKQALNMTKTQLHNGPTASNAAVQLGITNPGLSQHPSYAMKYQTPSLSQPPILSNPPHYSMGMQNMTGNGGVSTFGSRSPDNMFGAAGGDLPSYSNNNSYNNHSPYSNPSDPTVTTAGNFFSKYGKWLLVVGALVVCIGGYILWKKYCQNVSSKSNDNQFQRRPLNRPRPDFNSPQSGFESQGENTSNNPYGNQNPSVRAPFPLPTTQPDSRTINVNPNLISSMRPPPPSQQPPSQQPPLQPQFQPQQQIQQPLPSPPPSQQQFQPQQQPQQQPPQPQSNFQQQQPPLQPPPQQQFQPQQPPLQPSLQPPSQQQFQPQQPPLQTQSNFQQQPFQPPQTDIPTVNNPANDPQSLGNPPPTNQNNDPNFTPLPPSN